MALTAKFQADFTSFTDACNKAEVSLKSFEDGAGSVEKTLTRMGNSFSGVKVVQEATLMTKAMQDAGGMSALTDKELTKLGATVTEASEKMRKMGLDVPPGFQQITDATKNLHQETEMSVGSFIRGIPFVEAFIAAFSVERIFDFGKGIVEMASRFEDLHLATGISTTDLQKLSYVGQSFGVDTEQMARGVEQLSAKLASGDPNATKAIQMLGMSIKDLEATGPLEAFMQVVDGASRIQDPMQRSAVMTDLFGGKLAKVLLAMGDLRGAMEAVPKDAIISDRNIAAAHDFDVKIEHLTTTLKAYAVAAFQYALNEEHQGNKPWFGVMPNAPGVPAVVDDHPAVAAGQLDSATLLKNRLDALRTEALDPLTAAQQKNIDSLKSWGISEAEIAKLVGSNELAVHGYVDASQKQTEALKKQKKATDELAQSLIDLQDETDKAFAGVLLSVNGRSLLGNGSGPGPLGISTDGGISHTGLPTVNGGFAPEGGPLSGFGLGPAKLGAKTFDTGPAASFATDLFASVPSAIQAAIQGGGSKLQAAGSAIGSAVFGPNSGLTKTIDSGIASLFGSNGVLTKTLSSTVPIIGSLIGPAITGIEKLFGKSEESSKVSPVRDEFFKMQGGLEALNPKILETTGNLQLVQAVLSAKTVDSYDAAINNLTGAMDAYNAKVDHATSVMATLDGGFAHLTSISPDLQSALESAFNSKNIDDYNSALSGISGVLDTQAAQQKHLDDLASKYGLTLNDLGPQFAQGKIDELSRGLIDDWTTLSGLGGDNDDILKHMAGSFSHLASEAEATGREIPESLRDPLEKLSKMGLLTDDAGDKITDLGSLHFGDTLDNHLKDLQLALDGLKDTLDKLPGKFADAITGPGGILDSLGKIPKHVDVSVTAHQNTAYDDTSQSGDQADGASMGGMVTASGIQYLAKGGRVLQFSPKGSDTVPAMLTPGEVVKTANQINAEDARMDRLEAGLDRLEQALTRLPKKFASELKVS